MPMGCGGPHAAYLACRDEFKRGAARAGSSASASTRTARRPIASRCRRASSTSGARSATSNICTAQVLPAVVASMYAVYHGPDGLRRIAERVAALHRSPRRGARRLGCTRRSDSAFDTLTLDTGAATAELAPRPSTPA